MALISFERIWTIVLLSMISASVALLSQGMSVDWSAAAPLALFVIAAMIMAFFADRFTSVPLAKIIDFFHALALFSIISATGAVMTYAIAAASTGYIDASLADADRALGFNWLTFYGVIESNRLVAVIMEIAYENIFWSPLLLIAMYVWQGEIERLRVFLCVFMLAMVITIALFYWCPAQSAVPYYLGSRTGYHPTSGWPTAIIDNLRGGRLKVVNIAEAAGLITFPSFHAASAVIFLWAAMPLRMARTVLVPINVLMLLSTPIKGSHYFVDVVAGTALALACIALAHAPRLREILETMRFGLKRTPCPERHAQDNRERSLPSLV